MNHKGEKGGCPLINSVGNLSQPTGAQHFSHAISPRAVRGTSFVALLYRIEGRMSIGPFTLQNRRNRPQQQAEVAT